MLTQIHDCLCAYFLCMYILHTIFSFLSPKYIFKSFPFAPSFVFMFFFWPLLCQGVAWEILIIVAAFVRITGQVTTEDVQQRGQHMQTSSNHSLCTSWQCQLWVLEYNLFLETKSLACIIQAVQNGTLIRATRNWKTRHGCLSCVIYWLW